MAEQARAGQGCRARTRARTISHCALALVAALISLSTCTGLAHGQPVPAPPATIDGPSSDIVGLSGLAIARDGTGGLVYVKQVAGVPHVFVSRLVSGAFQAPEQVDAGLGGPSSQPVIGAANGGVLTMAFVNGGNLYALSRASTSTPSGTPFVLVAGASNPALQMTTLGKAYLAFTAGGAGGHDVRTAYFANGQWALEPTPLDAQPTDDAGVGSGRPAVAAAGDGVAIVVWGEAGHVYSRRVWATVPSVVYEQVDVPSLSGWQELSADEPSISSGGDSSYAGVVFHEVLGNGALQQSRVLMRRLRASAYDPPIPADGLATPAASGADQPQIALNEYGRGFMTSGRTDSFAVIAAHLRTNAVSDPPGRVDSLPSVSMPYAMPATAGLTSDLITWQHDPGFGGVPDIRVRYAPDGVNLGPELTVSAPAGGATDAADGLLAGGDAAGEAAIAWVQGAVGARSIVVTQMYQPPGEFSALTGFAYLRSSQPVLSWSTPHAVWGPVRYVVSVNGRPIAQTYATSLRLPSPLPDGRYRWQVAASNPAGLGSAASPGSFWIDTVAPAVALSLTGKRQVGSYLHAYARYTDSPPPEPRAAASGVASVMIRWGDGSSYRITHGKFHAYKRPGRYKISVTVTDRAGNARTVVRQIRIGRHK